MGLADQLREARRVDVRAAQLDADALAAHAAGEPVSVDIDRSIMDGQLLPTPGERPWQVISELVDEVVLVSDDEVRDAMRVLFERLKLVAEPSGASALAAVLAGRVHGKRMGVVLSGANVDAERFAELLG